MEITKEACITYDEFKDFGTYHKMFQILNETYTNPPLMKSFSEYRHASFVFCSNRLEDTIPDKLRQSDTFKPLESLCNEEVLAEPKVNS